MNKDELKAFVNKILDKKGYSPAGNFAQDFADGILFQIVFNSVFDEAIDCRL